MFTLQVGKIDTWWLYLYQSMMLWAAKTRHDVVNVMFPGLPLPRPHLRTI